jgi:DNA-binding NarL/FixJ family response regulator
MFATMLWHFFYQDENMAKIIIMDCDTYLKNGLSTYFTAKKNTVMVTSSLGDLLINLNDFNLDILIVELFSREDKVLDVINFIRNFSKNWPTKKLVIYTGITSEFAIRLVYCATQHKEIIFKNDNDVHLICNVFNSIVSNGQCVSASVNQCLVGVSDENILTAKEWDLLYRLAHDRDAHCIASELNIHMKTLSNHMANIARKLNCNNRIELWIKLSELINKAGSRAS